MLTHALVVLGGRLSARHVVYALPNQATVLLARMWWRQCSSQILPAHHKVVLPALSPTMESGSIISWEKAEGDKVSEGDLLAEVETDKASMGFESSEEGYLAKILVPAGTKDIPLGKLLCIIVNEKDDVNKFQGYADNEPAALSSTDSAPTAKPAVTAAKPAASPVIAPTTPGLPARSVGVTPSPAGMMASPRARSMASQHGVELSSVAPGSDGIIRSQHVLAAAAQPQKQLAASATATLPAEITLTDISSSPTAELLAQSKRTVPHYYLSIDIDMSAVEKACSLAASMTPDTTTPTTTDFIIKAAALACTRVPAANSSWADTCIHQHHSVNVAVQVMTEHGMVAPVVSAVERRGVVDITTTRRDLARRAAVGELMPADLAASTFSVTSLAGYGVLGHSAIVTPPHACALAVGATVVRLVPGDGAPVETSIMSATLSCDHRVVDGAVGAQWLAVFKNFLQEPLTMLL